MSRTTLTRARSAVLVAGLTATLAAPVPALPAYSAAVAAPPASSTQAGLGERAVEEASRHEGKPYRYGASGPDEFDCSGFTQYVFRQLGHELPRTARAQYDAVRHISPADESSSATWSS